jgi:hypothetical protein
MMLRVVGMRRLCLLALAVVAFAAAANAQQPPVGNWQPGKYRGLVTGKSTTNDVIRVLGLASWQGKPQEVPDVPGEEEWSYTIATPQGECCDLFFKNTLLESITLRLNSMMAGEAQQFFGRGFVAVRFSTYDDGSETGSGPICEDPKGDFTLLLNPKKGISLWSDERGIVKEAVYSHTRPGNGKCDTKDMKPSK